MARGKFNGQTKNAADTHAVALPDLSKMADTDKVTVVSEKRAGKTVIGIGKTPVVFDEDGRAEVTAKEAKYFLTIDGFELEGAETDSDTEKGGSEGSADDKSEIPQNTEAAGGENSDNGNETSVSGDGSEKSEENKDDSEKAAEADSDTEKAGAKKNAKGNK